MMSNHGNRLRLVSCLVNPQLEGQRIRTVATRIVGSSPRQRGPLPVVLDILKIAPRTRGDYNIARSLSFPLSIPLLVSRTFKNGL